MKDEILLREHEKLIHELEYIYRVMLLIESVLQHVSLISEITTIYVISYYLYIVFIQYRRNSIYFINTTSNAICIVLLHLIRLHYIYIKWQWLLSTYMHVHFRAIGIFNKITFLNSLIRCLHMPPYLKSFHLYSMVFNMCNLLHTFKWHWLFHWTQTYL